ncbi:MAG: GIY-YIG nuclease family protein [Candidatus Taylorbacteria bacterium]|nr:GIY-YIG nuclease family protein [Candidatus Taylorbacteria bacterium]
MYYTYILKSDKNNKYYIGSTSDLNQRLNQHNSGKVKSTKLYRPWSIYYFEKLDNEKDAILRERQIKSWKSRKMIEKLKFS